jgi:hypothetical protein
LDFLLSKGFGLVLPGTLWMLRTWQHWQRCYLTNGQNALWEVMMANKSLCIPLRFGLLIHELESFKDLTNFISYLMHQAKEYCFGARHD